MFGKGFWFCSTRAPHSRMATPLGTLAYSLVLHSTLGQRLRVIQISGIEKFSFLKDYVPCSQVSTAADLLLPS